MGAGDSLGVANGPKQGENHDIYKWLGPIARDLQLNKGASLVIAGEHQPPIVHALAARDERSRWATSARRCSTPTRSKPTPVDQLASLQDLVKDLDAGAVDLLLIIGGNPAFNAPVELGMRRPHPEGQAAGAPQPVRRRDHAKSASGICRKRTTSKRGAMRARSTARSPSSSR